MIRQSSESSPDDEVVDDAGEEQPNVSARDVINIRQTLEELASARCPLCHGVLVARQGRSGPYFFCRCVRRPEKRAS
jgi:ssDNA-binding Zn-finger/Zn-ribbon topoisomerase 1